MSAPSPEILELERLIERNELRSASALLEKLPNQMVSQVNSQLYKGIILGKQGKHDDAITLLSALEQQSPDNANIHNNLAVIYASQGEYEKAELALTKALGTHPSYQTSYQNLRSVYSHKASLAYSKALQNHAKPKGITLTFSFPEAVIQPANELAPPPQVVEEQTPPKIDPTTFIPEIKNSLLKWATAWSNKDLTGYLNGYSEDYAPENWIRRHWVRQRKERIERPSYIRVELSDIHVEMAGEKTAIVKLSQQYESDNYKDNERKLLILKKIGDSWKIIEEAKLG